MSRRVALCVLFAVVTLAGCGPVATTTTSKPAAISRREAEALLIGKTPDEVLKAWGKPESTSDSRGKPSMWTYRSRTVDPVSGKDDRETYVIFDQESGKVKNIMY